MAQADREVWLETRRQISSKYLRVSPLSIMHGRADLPNFGNT